MVTHEDDIAEHAKRIIRMRDGLIIDDGPSPRMKAAQAALIGTANLGPESVWESDDPSPNTDQLGPINDAELGPINQELTH